MNVSNQIHALYQEVILDHNKNPKNFKKLKEASLDAEGFNPVCGDHYHIYLQVDKDDKIIDISFDGQGCAISKASASMMTVALKGKTTSEAKVLFEEFHRLLTGKLNPDEEENHLGKLKIFSGIWKYPARVKCAGLSWHTLNAALEGSNETVKTE
jgi:nitrogen fixation NifU-like protein